MKKDAQQSLEDAILDHAARLGLKEVSEGTQRWYTHDELRKVVLGAIVKANSTEAEDEKHMIASAKETMRRIEAGEEALIPADVVYARMQALLNICKKRA